MKIIKNKPIYIREPIGIPLPELSMEQIEQLDEKHMSLEYCYELLIMAYQKSRELNEELEELAKELREDNNKLISIYSQHGILVKNLVMYR